MCQPKLGILTALAVTVVSLTGCATAYRKPDSVNEARAALPESKGPAGKPDSQPAAVAAAQCGSVSRAAAIARDPVVQAADDHPVLIDAVIQPQSKGRIIVIGQSLEEIEASVHAAILAESKRNAQPSVARFVESDGNVYYFVGDMGYDDVARRNNSVSQYQVIGDETRAPRRTLWNSLRPARKKDSPDMLPTQAERTGGSDQVAPEGIPIHRLISSSPVPVQPVPVNAAPVSTAPASAPPVSAATVIAAPPAADRLPTTSAWHSKDDSTGSSQISLPERSAPETPGNLLNVLSTNPAPFPAAAGSEALRLPD